MRLLIIDAMNLVRRIYAAAEKKGEMPLEEATRSHCLSVMSRQAEQWQASHVVMVTEWPAQTWRHQLWPDYKLGRPPMPEFLAQGLPEMLRYFHQSGIYCLSVDGWEADDVIASMAVTACQHRLEVLIVSTDKGFCQLVQPGIQVRNHFDHYDWDLARVEQQFGLLPSQLVDFWALMGDSTNHLPGVAGIGRKTAARLLDRFGSLDALLVQMADFGDERWSGLLQQHWQQALLTRLLARLRTDVSLGVSLSQLRYG